MAAATFYSPSPRGHEARIGERLAEWARRRAAKRGPQ
jgi:putative ATPase